MFRRKDSVAARIDTLVGKGARVHGDVEFSGGLHLDGCVTGNVRAAAGSGSTLSVSEQGSIEGSVEVPNVILNGLVQGDIRAQEKLVLGTQARVRGNVHYGSIEIALGAEIAGRLVPASSADGEPGSAAAPEPGLP